MGIRSPRQAKARRFLRRARAATAAGRPNHPKRNATPWPKAIAYGAIALLSGWIGFDTAKNCRL